MSGLFCSVSSNASRATRKLLIDQVNKMLGMKMDIYAVDMFFERLPFYKTGVLATIIDQSAKKPSVLKVLFVDQKSFILDGKNTPIYEANEIEAPILNDKTVDAYLDFFFHQTYGRHGRFFIIRTPEDLLWRDIIATPELPTEIKQAFAAIANGKTIKRQNSISKPYLIQFKESIFSSRISVDKEGVVKISDEEVVYSATYLVEDTHLFGPNSRRNKKEKKSEDVQTEESVHFNDLVD